MSRVGLVPSAHQVIHDPNPDAAGYAISLAPSVRRKGLFSRWTRSRERRLRHWVLPEPSDLLGPCVVVVEGEH